MKRQLSLAWFRAAPPDPTSPVDDTAALLSILGRQHRIELFHESNAHDFPWRQAQGAFDLAVYELDDQHSSAFIWPYLLRVPGVLVPARAWLQDSRLASLSEQRRLADARRERAFGGPPMLRAPMLASRIVVVSDTARARTLESDYPGACVRMAPVGVRGAAGASAGPRPARTGGLAVGVLDRRGAARVERVLARARAAGTNASLLTGAAADVLEGADIVVVLDWPPFAERLPGALAGMAAARPVVVLESELTAAWPALDPQTWRPRTPVSTAAPVAISIDPRDEEHSLLLAVRRLAADSGLRVQLGAAAYAWWAAHATPDHAAAAWAAILDEAISRDAPPRPPGWPGHLDADGTETARGILAAFGLQSDLF